MLLGVYIVTFPIEGFEDPDGQKVFLPGLAWDRNQTPKIYSTA